MTIEALEFLKSAVRVFKLKMNDLIFIYNRSIYAINEEKSCIKCWTVLDNSMVELLDMMNNTIHVVDAIKKNETVNTISPYVIHLVNTEDNVFTYEHKSRFLLMEYGETIKSFINSISCANRVRESEDFIHDPSYCQLLEEDIFAHGTGYGKIITPVRNRRYIFTLYKGLIPYLKTDRVELWFIDFDNCSYFTNFKVIKKASVLDVYTRNLIL